MSTDINLVLAEYERAVESGGAKLSVWLQRYPEYSEALTEFAMETEFLRSATNLPFDPQEEARVLDKVMTVGRKIANRQPAVMSSLLEAARRVELSPQLLAERLGIGLALLAKLERRLITLHSIPRALFVEISKLINVDVDQIRAYLKQPPALSASASYKASKTPQATQEDFGAALAACPGMTAEQKDRWASETDLVGEES